MTSRQRSSESVREFANRLEQLTADLTDACVAREGLDTTPIIQNLNSRTCLQAFLEGLSDPLKFLIKAGRYTSFRDAIESVVEEERILKQNKTFQNLKFYNIPERNIQGVKLQCFKCKNFGHKVDKCFAKLPTHPKRESGPSASQDTRINIICHYCKKPEHMIKDCYKKKNTDRRNNAGSDRVSGNDESPGASGSVVPARKFK